MEAFPLVTIGVDGPCRGVPGSVLEVEISVCSGVSLDWIRWIVWELDSRRPETSASSSVDGGLGKQTRWLFL